MLILNCVYKSREINMGSLEFSSCLIPPNFGNLIHSFMCWLKFHTKTCTMTSCQDSDIFFMSPVLKKLSPM